LFTKHTAARSKPRAAGLVDFGGLLGDGDQHRRGALQVCEDYGGENPLRIGRARGHPGLPGNELSYSFVIDSPITDISSKVREP
jgi:hypothetical protein